MTIVAYKIKHDNHTLMTLWCRGVLVITTEHLHSTKPKLRFCVGSNPTYGVSEICDDENF